MDIAPDTITFYPDGLAFSTELIGVQLGPVAECVRVIEMAQPPYHVVLLARPGSAIVTQRFLDQFRNQLGNYEVVPVSEDFRIRKQNGELVSLLELHGLSRFPKVTGMNPSRAVYIECAGQQIYPLNIQSFIRQLIVQRTNDTTQTAVRATKEETPGTISNTYHRAWLRKGYHNQLVVELLSDRKGVFSLGDNQVDTAEQNGLQSYLATLDPTQDSLVFLVRDGADRVYSRVQEVALSRGFKTSTSFLPREGGILFRADGKRITHRAEYLGVGGGAVGITHEKQPVRRGGKSSQGR